MEFGRAIGYTKPMEEFRGTVAEKVAEVFGARARLAGLDALAGDASSARWLGRGL